MNTMIITNLITILLVAAPVFAEGNSALSALTVSAGVSSVEWSVPPVSAPEPVSMLSEKGTQSWTDEVKRTYRQHLETGKLFTLPAVKNSELPAAALRQLNKDNYGQNPRVSTAYKLVVKNQPAFVIHNRRDGRGVTAHIFDAQGRLIALGRAGTAASLYWAELSSPSSGGSDPGGSGHHGSGGGPDDIDDGMGGQGPSGGGPDDTDWGGCGSPGSGGGSGPDDTGGGGF
ncbi:MAG: hypothetical protein Q7R35_03920 [Elusimicrobiota bacterium]|nr:hypothetical protein [Elusimicrobiota bacterium]